MNVRAPFGDARSFPDIGLVPPGAIFPHQPPMDLMGLSGTIKAAVLLDKLLFSSGAAS